VLLIPLQGGEPNLADKTSELLPKVWHPRVWVEPRLIDYVHVDRLELNGEQFLHSINSPAVLLSSVVIV